MLRLIYGNVPASARFDSSGRYLFVDLDRDPGVGSMHYGRISPTTVHVTGGDVDDIRRAAAAYRDALRYLSPGTGRDRHAAEADRLELLAGQLRAVCGECSEPLRDCRHGRECCRSSIGPACQHVTPV